MKEKKLTQAELNDLKIARRLIEATISEKHLSNWGFITTRKGRQ